MHELLDAPRRLCFIFCVVDLVELLQQASGMPKPGVLEARSMRDGRARQIPYIEPFWGDLRPTGGDRLPEESFF